MPAARKEKRQQNAIGEVRGLACSVFWLLQWEPSRGLVKGKKDALLCAAVGGPFGTGGERNGASGRKTQRDWPRAPTFLLRLGRVLLYHGFKQREP